MKKPQTKKQMVKKTTKQSFDIFASIKNFFQNLFKNLDEVFLYLLVFSIPLFFIPGVPAALSMHKQFFTLSLALLSFLFWVVNFIRFSKASFRVSFPLLISFLILISGLLSWAVNGYTNFGIFGLSGDNATSLFNLTLFFIVFLLTQVIFDDRKKILNAVMLFLSSSFLSGILWLASGVNTVGSNDSFVVFLTAAFVLAIGFFASMSSRIERLLLTLFFLILFWIFSLSGFTFSWVLLSVGIISFILIYFSSRGIFEKNKLVLTMLIVFLASSLLYSISGLKKDAQDLRLTYTTTKNIILNEYKSTEIAFFGTGPSSFRYSFLENRENITPNLGINRLQFGAGYSTLTDYFAELGFFGGALLIVFIAIVILFGARFMYFQVKSKKYDPIGISFFCALLILFSGLTFSSSNFVILFSTFLLSSVYLNYTKDLFKEKPMILQVSDNPKKALLGFSSAILVTIFIISMSYGFYKAYAAEIIFQNGQSQLANKNVAGFIGLANEAISTNSKNDSYQRNLANIKISILNQKMQGLDLNDQNSKNSILNDASQIENIIKSAIVLNNKEYSNWSVLGSLYETIAPLNNNYMKLAQEAYQKALSLNPKDADVLFLVGKTHYALGESVEAEKIFLELSKILPSNTDIRFYLGLSYLEAGSTDQALGEFIYIKALDPQNKIIDQVISQVQSLNKKK